MTMTKTYLALANFLKRITQGATVRRIGQYVRNWWRWVRAGVGPSAVGPPYKRKGTLFKYFGNNHSPIIKTKVRLDIKGKSLYNV
jgi:hypothetical protein